MTKQTNLRLLRIEHIKCNEYGKATYICAPREWTSEDIEKHLDLA